MTDIRQHGITGAFSPVDVTEKIVVLEDEVLSEVYSIQLKEAIFSFENLTVKYTTNTDNGDKATLTDRNFSITATSSIAEKRCSVSLIRGKIYFHVLDENFEVEVSYKGIGSPPTDKYFKNLVGTSENKKSGSFYDFIKDGSDEYYLFKDGEKWYLNIIDEDKEKTTVKSEDNSTIAINDVFDNLDDLV